MLPLCYAAPPWSLIVWFWPLQSVANPVGSILSTKGKYQDGWEAMNADPDNTVAHENREALENFLVRMMQNRAPSSNGDVTYSGIRLEELLAISQLAP